MGLSVSTKAITIAAGLEEMDKSRVDFQSNEAKICLASDLILCWENICKVYTFLADDTLQQKFLRHW